MIVGCIAANGDMRGDYFLWLGPGAMIRDLPDGDIQVWTPGTPGKHLIQVDYRELVRDEIRKWRVSAEQADADAQEINAAIEARRA